MFDQSQNGIDREANSGRKRCVKYRRFAYRRIRVMTWEWIVVLIVAALLFEFLVKREFIRLWNKVWDLEKRLKRLEDGKDHPSKILP
jgi:hypothetical protein